MKIKISPAAALGRVQACLIAGATLLLLSILALSSAAAAGATTLAGFNRVTYAYSTTYTTSQEANQYQVMVLQSSDAAVVPLLKAANPNLKIFAYQGIQAAENTTWAFNSCMSGPWVFANHPSWIMHDQNGNPLLYQNHYLMDVGNTSYQQTCLTNAIAMAKKDGFDGIYWDMVNAKLAWTLPAGSSVPEYPTDASWQSALYSMLSYSGSQLHANGLMDVANIGGSFLVPGLWAQWNGPLDGAEDEGFTDNKAGPAAMLWAWPSQLANIAWSEANHKLTLVHSWNTTEAGNTYGVASMMLAANGESSYSTSNGCYSACETWYPEYTTAQGLGAPLAPYTKLSNGVYERVFQKGLVLVNASGNSIPTFSLGGGTFTGSGLTSVSTVTMGPTSGLVLLADASGSGLSIPPANAVVPAVSGTAATGSTLTASSGSWSGTPTPAYSYQWDRCTTTSLTSCAPISGATGSTYAVQSTDTGSYLDVVVTATNTAGVASAASAETAQVPVASTPTGPANTSRPVVSGTAAVGSTLTASSGSWSGTPTPASSYQWDRCTTTSVSSCTPISGATSSSYAVQAADGGDYLDVVVTATNSAGSASAASNETVRVPTFTLALSTTSRTIARGGYTWTQANVGLVAGFKTAVALSVSGLPSGATASFNYTSTTAGSVLSIWTAKTSPAGTYHVVVTGTAGGQTKQATLTLTLT